MKHGIGRLKMKCSIEKRAQSGTDLVLVVLFVAPFIYCCIKWVLT